MTATGTGRQQPTRSREDATHKGYFRRYFDERTTSNLEAYSQAPRSLSSHCYQRRLAICLEWLQRRGLEPGAAVLDAGCGASPLVHEIQRLGHRTWGIDHSLEMLRRAQGAAGGRFAQADVEALPFPDGAFDAVFCLGVTCYLPSDGAALRELSRVTRRGGMLVLSVPHKFNLSALTDPALYVWRKLQPLLRRPGASGNGAAPYTERYYTIPQVDRLLAQAGFVPEEFRTLGYGPVTVMGRPLSPPGLTVRLSRAFEAMHRVPTVRTLGARYLVRATKRW